jgi:putative hemolysin
MMLSEHIESHLPKQAHRVRVPFVVDTPRFLIKTVDCKQELASALKLRFNVFYKEMMGFDDYIIGFDQDRFDRNADLLVIIDKENNKVIGTYRFIISENIEDFYTASEFDLRRFLRRPGVKMEMSRACIHQDYRKGTVIAMLWRGIAEYAARSGAEFLFGCSSVWSMDPQLITSFISNLETMGCIDENLEVVPQASYYDSRFFSVDTGPCSSVDEVTPPLIKAYIKAGAKFASIPALDKSFKCYDLFTCLDLRDLTDSYRKKYNLDVPC